RFLLVFGPLVAVALWATGITTDALLVVGALVYAAVFAAVGGVAVVRDGKTAPGVFPGKAVTGRLPAGRSMK
ncbi:MAG TPA: hypothetical protein DEH78_03225, partial [Solibacterales bacterium]|nr:hypothetical protein [Bryobacterales bacterium]